MKKLFTLFAFNLFFLLVNAQIPTDSLVAYYPFNGNANDESGNGYDGTVNGATLTTDRFGNINSAYSFTNSPQNIAITYLYQNNITDYSISGWFLKNQNSVNIEGTIISGSYPSENPAGLRLDIGNMNRFQWQAEGNPGINGILQNTPGDTANYADGLWHHFAAIFSSPPGLISSTSFEIYVDGAQVLTQSCYNTWPGMDTSVYAPINNGLRPTIIGNCAGNYYNLYDVFNGKIDDIRIYNRALTQSEIVALFNEGQTDGLIAYYPFNGNANDESGNGNNGIVDGAVLIPDRFGNPNSAYSFNGETSIIDCGNGSSLQICCDITACVWIKTNYTGSLAKDILGKYDWTFAGWDLTTYLDKVAFVGRDDPYHWCESGYSSESINDNNWHFVVGQREGSVWRIFVDGILSNQTDIGTSGNLICSIDLNIGCDWHQYHFDGAIDDIRIYNRALTQSEITELYNEGQIIEINANFSATPLEGVAPLTVQFTDESTGNPSVWIWDFQNDGVNDAFIQNPTFTCEEAGEYSVRLIVINATETDTMVQENYITVNPQSTQEGLIAYFPFNGNANDESGNGNDGTVYGSTLTTDRFGNSNSAYYFDGNDDYIDIGSFPVNAFTFAGWIYCENINQSNLNAIISRMNYSYGGGGFEFHIKPDSRLQMIIGDQGGWNNTYSNIGINTQQWYFVVSTYDSSTVNIYIDANLDGSNPCGYNIEWGGEIDFGTRPNDGVHDGWYEGVIDDFRIYDRALTSDEILELYNENQITTPEICIVSVTPDEHNKVIWEEQQTDQIESYNIYRETTQTNVYEVIGSVPYADSSIFVDLTSNPQQRPYKYKVSAVSTSGTETALSNYHRTIHLTINQGPVGWNLIWSPYEGFPFSTYYIYRGTTPTSLALLDSISGSFTSYTDINPPWGPLYYAIEIVNENGCNPTREGGYDRSRSNVQYNGVVGIVDNPETNIRIYPNPTHDFLNIEMDGMVPNADAELIIYNVQGKAAITQRLKTGKTIVDINNLQAGIYIITLKYQKNILTRKLVVY